MSRRLRSVFVTVCRAGPDGSEDDADDGDHVIDQDDVVDGDGIHFAEDYDDLDEGEDGGEDEVRNGDVHENPDLLGEGCCERGQSRLWMRTDSSFGDGGERE